MEIASRKPNRLPGYDYSKHGLYFVTVCTKKKRKLFWIRGEDVKAFGDPIPLSDVGLTVEEAVQRLSEERTDVRVDCHTVMPDHVHLILALSEDGVVDLSEVVRYFKTTVTMSLGQSVWQRSYYDRIIRDTDEYHLIRNYIKLNPLRWRDDDLSPEQYLTI